VEARSEEYLNHESRVTRQSPSATPVNPAPSDGRVHCCLYFIAPSGHGLKPLDVEFMQRLHDRVNIVPVLAKADTMTPEECVAFKKQVSFVGLKSVKPLVLMKFCFYRSCRKSTSTK
jgi:septin 7